MVLRTLLAAWSPPVTPSSSCCPPHPRCPLQMLQQGSWSPSDASLASKCHPCFPWGAGGGGLLAGLAFKTHKLIPPLARASLGRPASPFPHTFLSGPVPALLPAICTARTDCTSQRLLNIAPHQRNIPGWGNGAVAGNGTRAAPTAGLKARGGTNWVLPGECLHTAFQTEKAEGP